MNDLDYYEAMDVEYEKRVERETEQQKELRHLFLDGKPATLTMFTNAGFLNTEGRYDPEGQRFVFRDKNTDLFEVFHGTQVQQLLLVVGSKRVIGQITLNELH